RRPTTPERELCPSAQIEWQRKHKCEQRYKFTRRKRWSKRHRELVRWPNQERRRRARYAIAPQRSTPFRTTAVPSEPVLSVACSSFIRPPMEPASTRSSLPAVRGRSHFSIASTAI